MDTIYATLQKLPEFLNRKVLVAMRRFNKAKETNDISIKVALYHVAINHLLFVLENKQISIYSKKQIMKVFERYNIPYNADDINRFEEFNKIRNQLFKGIEPDFKYTDEVFKTINIVLGYSAKLFSKIFCLDKSGEKLISDSISANHFYQHVR